MPLFMGRGSYIHQYTNTFDGSVYVGNYTSIAKGCIFLGRSNHYSVVNRKCVTNAPFGDPGAGGERSGGDIYIGSDVWIGTNVIVLPDVTIGHGAIIGAGCVVGKDVSPYTVVVGNPQRTTKRRFDLCTVQKLLAIRWWDWPDDLKERQAEFQDVYSFVDKFYPRFASSTQCDILSTEEDGEMKYLVMLAVFCGALLAGEADIYTQGLAELRRAQTDHSALIPAIRLLTKAATEFEVSGDARASEANSCLYWAKKRMTMADTEAVKSDMGIIQKIEAVSKAVPVDQAKTMLDAAEAFAGKSQDSLLVAVRFFEIADRFPEVPEGRKAMSRSLEAMARVGTEKLAVYKSVATDGRAFIQSDPAGAQIILLTEEGRKDMSKRTPSLVELPKGSQTIELALKGFKSSRLTVVVNGTISKPEKVVLGPLTIPMDVTFESGWKVFVDGKATKTETPCTVDMSLGNHTVGLAKEGFTDVSQRIGVTEGGQAQIDIKAKPNKGISQLLAPPTYLCDLQESKKQVWENSLGKQGKWPTLGKTHVISVNGKLATKGLITAPIKQDDKAFVCYTIGGSYRTFDGAVALNDSSEGKSGLLIFEIMGDGRSLWKSKSIKSGSVEEFSISVVRVNELTLIVTGGFAWAHAAWIDPALH